MKSFTKVSCFLILLSCIQDLKEEKKFYENGTIKSVGTYLKGEKHSEFKYYTEKGNLDAILNWKHGKLDGKGIYYYDFEKNQIETIMHWSNGIKNGSYTEYFPDGNIKKQGEYRNGLFYGKYFFYENGRIKKTTIEKADTIYSYINYNEDEPEEWFPKYQSEAFLITMPKDTIYDGNNFKCKISISHQFADSVRLFIESSDLSKLVLKWPFDNTTSYLYSSKNYKKGLNTLITKFEFYKYDQERKKFRCIITDCKINFYVQ